MHETKIHLVFSFMYRRTSQWMNMRTHLGVHPQIYDFSVSVRDDWMSCAYIWIFIQIPKIYIHIVFWLRDIQGSYRMLWTFKIASLPIYSSVGCYFNEKSINARKRKISQYINTFVPSSCSVFGEHYNILTCINYEHLATIILTLRQL